MTSTSDVIDGQVASEPSDTRRLDPSELAYFKKVADGLIRANQLEVEANRMLQEATGLRGAYESWTAHLAERYALDPSHGPIQIDPEDGTIRRNGSS